MPVCKVCDTGPDVFHSQIGKTKRLGISAIVRAWFVGTGFTFEDLRKRTQRCKPLRQLRTENRKSGHIAKRSQMARPGIVADENASPLNKREQLGDVLGTHWLLPVISPPGQLVGI